MRTVTRTDTLCTGDRVGTIDNRTGDLGCLESVSDRLLVFDCQTTRLRETGCFSTASFKLSLERDRDSLVGTGETFYRVDGACTLEYATNCEMLAVTADRIGTEPGDCATPVLPTTWGRIKALYR